MFLPKFEKLGQELWTPRQDCKQKHLRQLFSHPLTVEWAPILTESSTLVETKSVEMPLLEQQPQMPLGETKVVHCPQS